MISDEMRELLSAYVDGELRDSDAARVEELSKRDPELRKEIEAYRKLRKKLRDWDETEHAVAPAATLKKRALARARFLVANRRAVARGRRLSLLSSPVSVAATLLLAAGAGLLVARAAPAPAPPPLEAAEGRDGGGVLPPPPRTHDDLVLEGSALVDPEAAPAPVAPSPWMEILIPSRRARELRVQLEREERQWESVRRELEAAGGERRTVTPSNPVVVAMVSGYAPIGAALDGLVLLDHPRVHEGLPPIGAVPAGKRIGRDQDTRRSIYLDGSGLDHAILSPLGEVWVGAKDGSGRTRVVVATSLSVKASEFIPAVWADEIGRPRGGLGQLEVQDFILGPAARKRLLEAERGRDAELLAWLRRSYGDNLAAAFAAGARERERVVARLVRALEKSPSATGFAVVDGRGELLGIELFATHRLMLDFAPRLLRGYLFEAGDRGIALQSPKGSGGPAAELVGRTLEGFPQRAAQVEEVDVGRHATGEPAGTRRVNLLHLPGVYVGHGLLDAQDHPIHLTLFGR